MSPSRSQTTDEAIVSATESLARVLAAATGDVSWELVELRVVVRDVDVLEIVIALRTDGGIVRMRPTSAVCRSLSAWRSASSLHDCSAFQITVANDGEFAVVIEYLEPQ